MGKTSVAAKQRWNDKHYAQVKVSVPKELAAEFKTACRVSESSMSGTLSAFMESYCARPVNKKTPQIQTTTRRHRRNALTSLIGHLEQIRDAEESYRDNIPENLSGSSVYAAADECVSLLDEAIDILESAYH